MVSNRRIRGVALICYNPRGEILILQEYRTKPRLGKYRGMFSVPMETLRHREREMNGLVRLIQEELPGFSLSPPITRIGIYQIPGCTCTLYSMKTIVSCLPTRSTVEVGNYQWIDPKKALTLWLRWGVWEMINDFLEGKREVFCRCCRIPTSAPVPAP